MQYFEFQSFVYILKPIKIRIHSKRTNPFFFAQVPFLNRTLTVTLSCQRKNGVVHHYELTVSMQVGKQQMVVRYVDRYALNRQVCTPARPFFHVCQLQYIVEGGGEVETNKNKNTLAVEKSCVARGLLKSQLASSLDINKPITIGAIEYECAGNTGNRQRSSNDEQYI